MPGAPYSSAHMRVCICAYNKYWCINISYPTRVFTHIFDILQVYAHVYLEYAHVYLEYAVTIHDSLMSIALTIQCMFDCCGTCVCVYIAKRSLHICTHTYTYIYGTYTHIYVHIRICTYTDIYVCICRRIAGGLLWCTYCTRISPLANEATQQ
jgi:hypothetical protein